MKTLSKILLLVPVFSSIAQVAQAQPLPPDSTPIDPVSWIVLGAGAAIGGKKYYDARRKKQQEDDG